MSLHYNFLSYLPKGQVGEEDEEGPVDVHDPVLVELLLQVDHPQDERQYLCPPILVISDSLMSSVVEPFCQIRFQIQSNRPEAIKNIKNEK